MQPIRLIQLMILLLSLLKAFSMIAEVQAHAPEASHKLYIPVSMKVGDLLPPPPPPPPVDSELPADLVTTWYTGALPLTDFYDPATGSWRAQNGLGETYTFHANGDYIYAAFLRLQNGQCFTEASSYREGKARIEGNQLVLTPDLAKTRTVVRCGSNSDSTTDGPFTPTILDYTVGEEPTGHPQLILTSNGSSTAFYRHGMVESLVGNWQRGAVTSSGFFDAARNSFAPQDDAGAWYRFNADSTYEFGEFGYGTNDQGCALTAWVYQKGTMTIMGGRLTTTPLSGAVRVDNACAPGTPEVQPYVEGERSFTWLFRDRDSAPKLVIIPLEAFQEFVYQPE